MNYHVVYRLATWLHVRTGVGVERVRSVPSYPIRDTHARRQRPRAVPDVQASPNNDYFVAACSLLQLVSSQHRV